MYPAPSTLELSALRSCALPRVTKWQGLWVKIGVLKHFRRQYLTLVLSRLNRIIESHILLVVCKDLSCIVLRI